MVTSNVVTLKTPANFDFSKPDQWSKWKRRFEQFASASGLDKEEDARRISTLLYCLGEEADDVLNSTNISAEDAKKYDKVIGKFDEYFQVRKNVIYERARFNRRDQLEGESAEEYITALYALVRTCDYKADQQDEMLRDRLVVGIRDKAVSDKLQLEAGLTLESAKKTIRQREAIKEHRQELQGAAGESRKSQSVVEDVTGRSTHKPPRDRARGASQIVNHPSKAGDQTKETPVHDVAGRSTQLERDAQPREWFATDATGKATSKLSVYQRPWPQWRPQKMILHSLMHLS